MKQHIANNDNNIAKQLKELRKVNDKTLKKLHELLQVAEETQREGYLQAVLTPDKMSGIKLYLDNRVERIENTRCANVNMADYGLIIGGLQYLIRLNSNEKLCPPKVRA